MEETRYEISFAGGGARQTAQNRSSIYFSACLTSSAANTDKTPFVAMRRKVVLFCLLLAVVQRALGQGIIGSTLPCEAPGEDPDPNNPEDNLSCPFQDQSIMRCYSRTELCNGAQFCAGSTDEGVNIVSLNCSKLSIARFAWITRGQCHKISVI